MRYESLRSQKFHEKNSWGCGQQKVIVFLSQFAKPKISRSLKIYAAPIFIFKNVSRAQFHFSDYLFVKVKYYFLFARIIALKNWKN